MKLQIEHRKQYSRKELLLRTFLGWLYIGIPHGFALFLFSIIVFFATLIEFFIILATTRYPRWSFDIYLNYVRWNTRVTASLLNLVDGYPPFGAETRWTQADFDIAYPEAVSRGRLLFASVLGVFVLIPQIAVLYLRLICSMIIGFVAFWVVLRTKKYPKLMHEFQVGTLRMQMRITMYTGYLYFKYPAFTGRENDNDKLHIPKITQP